jgi:uncharacterized iron-regulated membrane protein
VTSVLILHAGHAGSTLEVVLMLFGLALSLGGLGLAAITLWPRRPSQTGRRPRGRARRRRNHGRGEPALLHEDVHRRP